MGGVIKSEGWSMGGAIESKGWSVGGVIESEPIPYHLLVAPPW